MFASLSVHNTHGKKHFQFNWSSVPLSGDVLITWIHSLSNLKFIKAMNRNVLNLWLYWSKCVYNIKKQFNDNYLATRGENVEITLKVSSSTMLCTLLSGTSVNIFLNKKTTRISETAVSFLLLSILNVEDIIFSSPYLWGMYI